MLFKRNGMIDIKQSKTGDDFIKGGDRETAKGVGDKAEAGIDGAYAEFVARGSIEQEGSFIVCVIKCTLR